ncbi:GPW/gp25 family protein [Methylobacterium iners]|uniref:IraD/Gp25-like domain-containing protein n=1 Tax=Methylobacterium iners TaxID=418707 RepID=A0ABQ4RRJ1_9HYPH|nr:GPW/gp25 family protein [Methylobacterium iners]GJD93339.1 hypothetical protein OCOJLMKI_0532 [Methylobacterium iners]
MIRYRSGIDRRTGKALRGFDHVRQSVEVILRTLLTERLMLLDFGFPGVRHIGRNLTAPVVLAIYRDARKAIRRWEPEYDIRRFQLVRADRTGLLALGTTGIYYPEGRFNNFKIAEPVTATFALSDAETAGPA